MHEEWFDVVNEHDQVVDRRPRDDVHRLGLLHRAVHILVFNQTGDLFMQKRSVAKDEFPGLWDSSTAGHVGAGETYAAAARRELQEELGVDGDLDLQRLFKIEGSVETANEFAWVYRTVYEGPFVLQLTEIDEGRWFSREQLTAWIETSPETLTPAFRYIWKRLPVFE